MRREAVAALVLLGASKLCACGGRSVFHLESDAEAGSNRGGGANAAGGRDATGGTTAAGSGGRPSGASAGTGGRGMGGDGRSQGDRGAAGGGQSGSAAGASGGRSGTAGGGEAAAGAAGSAGATGGGVLGNPARDIERTELDVDLDALEATATLTLAPAPTPGASFEIGDLEIHAVTSEGAALDFSDEGARLDVELPAAETSLRVEISYRFREHTAFDGYSGDGFTFTWPYYCGNLFPCHSEPADGTRFGLQVAGGTGTLIYPTEIPVDAPAYMAAWAQGDYVEVPLGTTPAGTLVSYYRFTEARSSDGDGAYGTARLAEAFAWYETHLGPYAFGSKVASVAVDWPNANFKGMEHHPFWHVGRRAMGLPLTHMHEAAHGWFGNGVRLRCWEDAVLSEGTASYLAAHVLEELGETDEAVAAWQVYESVARKNVTSPTRKSACLDIDPLASEVYSPAMYARGALFYRALEQRIGRAAVETALAVFYAAWVGQAAGWYDLLDAVYTTSGYDPSACSALWLDSETRPPFDPCE